MRHPQYQTGHRQKAGDRRTATLLFCDVVGSTAIAEQLDPEDWSDLLDEALEIIANAIRRFGGHCDNFTGDGLLAVFGAPRAMEDDPKHAVRAALEMLEDLKPLQSTVLQDFGLAFDIRIGINTGFVVYTEVAGSSVGQKTVMGDAVNVAARRQSEAQPGTIAVSRAKHALTHHDFAFEQLGVFSLKGKSEGVPIYRALSYTGAATQIAPLQEVTPFVGRSFESTVLANAFQRAQTGTAQVVSISGEAGIGKSRLVQEFMHALDTDDHLVQLKCSQIATANEVAPIARLADQLCRTQGAEIDPANTKASMLDVAFNGLKASLPVFQEILALPVADPSALQVAPKIRQAHLVEGLVHLLMTAARRKPVVIIAEDLHWADQEFEDVLSAVIERVAVENVMIITTARPEFKPPWSDHPNLSKVELEALEVDSLVSMLCHHLGSDTSDNALKQIVDRTDGNPFFFEELCLNLQADGATDTSGIATKGSEHAIPLTIQGTLQARIDTLGSSAKRVLQVASAIGQTSDERLLGEVIGAGNTISGHVRRLEAERFLTRQGDGSYSFRHALMRDVAYESLLKRDRVQIHQRIIEALTAQDAGIAQTRPELLAHHEGLGNRPEDAIVHWHEAAQIALRRSASRDALVYLDKAMRLAERLPETAEATAAEAKLQTARGVALVSTQGYASGEARIAFDRASNLLENTANPDIRAMVLRGLWSYFNMRGQTEAAEKIAGDLVALAVAHDDSGLLMEAKRALAITHHSLGNLSAANGHLDASIALHDSKKFAEHAAKFGQDPLVAALTQSAAVTWYLGNSDTALARIERAINAATQINHPFSLAGATLYRALIHQMRREPTEALRAADQALQISNEIGAGLFALMAGVLRGWALAHADAAKPDLSISSEALVHFEATGTTWMLPDLLVMHAEACVKVQAFKDAEAALDQAEALIAQTGEVRKKAHLLNLRGDIAIAWDKDTPGALQHAHEAAELAANQGAKILELRARVRIAAWTKDPVALSEAREALKLLHREMTEGHDTQDHRDVVVALREA